MRVKNTFLPTLWFAGKTVVLLLEGLHALRHGGDVHLVALRNPDVKTPHGTLRGKFPYQGHFITFCASLMEKKFTKADFPGQPKPEYPVLGIRAK